MISLSKIFKTNKLSYILRESEEDDFTVDAPKGWGINDLEIGDTIVPNMWDLEKIEQAISQNNIAYPNWFAEPHTIESFTHSKDVVFTDGTKRSLYFLKLFLQPQYQIINVDPLSESDEFNIDAPEEWGVEPLTVGSTITPDMWKEAYLNKDITIYEIWYEPETEENEEEWLVYIEPYDVIYNLDYLNDKLKHPYKIITDLNESQDEFNIDAPEDWGVEPLTVGDTITPDMWDENQTQFNYSFITKQSWTIDEVNLVDDYEDNYWGCVLIGDENGEYWDDELVNVNGALKHPYKIITGLNESQDDFTVDVPKDWNIEELTVGDTITPDMWQDSVDEYWKSLKSNPLKIIGFNSDWEGPYVEFMSIEPDKINRFINIDLDEVNEDLLKPQYKVVMSLSESDEYNIDAPKEWGAKDLKVGDYFYISVIPKWNGAWSRLEDVPKDIPVLKQIMYIGPNKGKYSDPDYGNENLDVVNFNFVNEPVDSKGYTYINEPLNENKDEFNIDAPKEWDIGDLKVGDKLIPDMFQPNTNLYDWASSFDLTLKKIDFKNNKITYILTYVNGETNTGKWNLDYFEKDLAPGYELKRPSLSESDDEFTVDVPEREGWDETELRVGHYFNMSMNPDFSRVWNNLEDVPKSIRHFIKQVIYIGPNVGQYKSPEYKDHVNIIAYNFPTDKDRKDRLYAISFEEFNKRWSKQMNASVYSYLEESEDEFNVDAPLDWDEYDGNIIITYEIENEGEVYVPVADEEEFERLNPNIKINYSEEPIYVDIIYKSKSVNINEFIKKLENYSEELLPFTGPKTTENFKLWLGNNDYYLAYFYRFLNPTAIKKKYATDDRKPVRVTKKMEENIFWRDDEVGVTILNVQFIDNINESEDDFTVDAPKDWNVIELTVGDEITPDMWEEMPDSPKWTKNSILLTNFVKGGTYNDDDPDAIVLKISGRDYESRWELNYINSLLKPEYLIVPPTDLYESDEFTVDAPKDWNKIELTVGSLITPDMYTDEAVERWNYGANKKMGSKTWGESVNYFWTKPQTIYKVYPTYDGNNDLRLKNGLILSSSDLKDQYLIVSNMLESKNEFDIDAPEEWNVKDLTIGDIITRDMFKPGKEEWWMDNKDEKSIKAFEFEIDDGELIVYLNKKDNIFSDNWVFSDSWVVKAANEDLKPQFQIVSPNNLSESKDEFNIDAPKEWNFKELGVGDSIVSSMFKNPKSSKRFWMPKVSEMIIAEFDPQRQWLVRVMPKGGNIKTDLEPWNIYSVNQELKDQYKIVFPEELAESQDEFTVDVSPDWNIEELTVGSAIEPNMWKKTEIANYNPNTNEIEGVKFSQTVYILEVGKDSEGKYVVLNKNNDFDGFETWWDLDTLNDNLEEPYKIISNLTESKDEFTVDAPQDWSVIELKVGDTITPDMWERDNFIQETVTIADIWYEPETEEDYGGYMVRLNFPHGRIYDLDLDILNDNLKHPYQIFSPLNESDEFSVDVPQGWNIKELGINDILDYTNMEISDVNISYKIVDFKKNEYGSDLVGLIKYEVDSNEKKQQWNIVPSYWYVSMANKKLKPGYEIVIPESLRESDDDFTVDAPKEWGIEGLTVGDTLDPSNLKMQNFRKKYEILGFTQRPWGTYVRLGVYELVEEPISGIRRTSKQWKYTKDHVATLNGLNDLLKDGYKIVTPESLRESNDDFNVTPDKIWNELDIGDIVLNKNLSSAFYQFKNVPFEIVNEINLGDEEYWWVEPYKNKDKEKLKKIINTLTNNKWEKETYGMWVMKKNVEPYQGPINEDNDDDFTVDAPKNWNLNYEQPINITISYEEEVRDRMGKYGVLLKSYFTQTNLTELEQVAGYNFTYDELTPHNVQRFITDDQDLLIEIEDMASDSNIETIESDNGFDFDDYKSIDINNFYVDVEFPVA